MRFRSVASQQNIGRARLYVASVASAPAHALPFTHSRSLYTLASAFHARVRFPRSRSLSTLAFVTDEITTPRVIDNHVLCERNLEHRIYTADRCHQCGAHASQARD